MVFLCVLTLVLTGFFMLLSPLDMRVGILLIASIFAGIQWFVAPALAVVIVGWVAIGLAALLLYARPLRFVVLSKPFASWFKRQLPPISPVEQMVLDSGGAWWEKLVFSGKPNWSDILTYKVSSMSEAEQAFLDNQVSTLCGMLNEWEINNKTKDLPKCAWNYIKREKFWALCLDVKYGGLGFSQAAHSAIVTKIASKSISAAYTVMVPNSLGPAELIDYCGTQAQKEFYLPRLATGEDIGCFGLTSLHAGSDAASVPDRGTVCHKKIDGEDVLGVLLNFSKRYITLAPVATLIGLAFYLEDPDQLLDGSGVVGVTVALVSSELPGVVIGKRHSPLTLGFMNGPVEGKQVFIPMDCIIGGQENCGQGWKILMGCLSVGRGISMPALSAAIAQQCVRLTGPYAKIRRQFKTAVGSFEGVQAELAKVGGCAYLIEATRYCMTQAVEEGARPSVAAAIAKYHLTELSRQILQAAMDVHSGHAIQAGPSNLLAEVYSGFPVSTVGEGANVMTRNLIIFGQGVMRAHPFVRNEILAAMHSDKDPNALASFDREFFHHLRFSFRSWVKGAVQGWLGGRLLSGSGRLKKQQQTVERLSNAFVCAADLALLKLGKNLKKREFISARLGDILSYLTLATCVIKYYHDHEAEGGDEELVFAEWALQLCFHKVGAAFQVLFENFPRSFLMQLFKINFFPRGTHVAYPKDRYSQRVAESLQVDSIMRKRLSSLCYVGVDANDPIGRVEMAWHAVCDSEPVFAKVTQAISEKKIARQLTRYDTIELALSQGVITCAEYTQLISAEKMRDSALAVDEFAFDEFLSFNARVMDSVNMD